MKKFFTFLIIFIFPIFAVDLKEKLGIGVGWNMPSDFFYYPSFVCGKIGISSQFAIEPYLALWYFSQEKEFEWGIGGIVDYAYRSKEKSNLYLKGGMKLRSLLLSGKWKYLTTEFIVGLGIEIWLFKNFSIDFSAYTKCGYHKNYEKSSSTLFAHFSYPFALIFYY
ncbi:MAG: hypothetical protein RMJ34_04870 [candidate division WOR-3 bacterium]|nr:hypothetical protein [candidate division WOR-3 bacterium]MDW8114248.1 hypothetical protein [candidate division WOR-3 bacterium]